jgi:chromosome segregation ATPase
MIPDERIAELERQVEQLTRERNEARAEAAEQRERADRLERRFPVATFLRGGAPLHTLN